MKNFLKIGNKKIGEKFKPFIICELGINHSGSLKVAKKMVDLAYKWEDPPTPTRSTTLVKIEKQPIYFALKKVISPRFYKSKIKSKNITKDDAKSEIIEILDIAIMIRYQETEELESILRGIENGDQVLDIFKNQIELIYF